MSDIKVGDRVHVAAADNPDAYSGPAEVRILRERRAGLLTLGACVGYAIGTHIDVPYGRISPAPLLKKPESVFDFGARKRYVDPETGYEKDTSAYRFDLVPADALAELAKVYGTGETKYPSGPEGPNWLSGGPLWPSRAALGRHLASYDLGQDVDPSDECYELAKVAWHAFGLLVYHLRGIGNDTRGRLKLINEGEVSQ